MQQPEISWASVRQCNAEKLSLADEPWGHHNNICHSASAALEHCVDTVSFWMSASRRQVNRNKTELIWVGTEKNLQRLLTVDSWYCTYFRRWSPRRRRQFAFLMCSPRQICYLTNISSLSLASFDYCNCMLASALKTTSDKLEYHERRHTSHHQHSEVWPW